MIAFFNATRIKLIGFFVCLQFVFFILLLSLQLSLVITVRSSPVKVSKPQAVTSSNLTDAQIKQLTIEQPPPVDSISSSDDGSFSSFPLYLPDPERSKVNDESFEDNSSVKPMANPIKLTLSLDPFSPPLNVAPPTFTPQVQQAENDKTSYSYSDRYDYYFPVRVVYDKNENFDEKELSLMEFTPPAQSNDEPNYYTVKPKKMPKKFQPGKKDVNQHKSKNETPKLVPIDNDGLVLPADKREIFVTAHPVERFLPPPTFRQLTDDDLNIGEYMPGTQPHTEAITLDATVPTLMIGDSTAKPATRRQLIDAGDLDTNKRPLNDDERVEFQMHGFNGPNSYKFGFDTGNGSDN